MSVERQTSAVRDEPSFVNLQDEVEKIGTVPALYRKAVENFPSRVFIRAVDDAGEEIRVTYAASAQILAAITLSIQNLDLKADDRVICYLEEQIPSVWFFL